MNKNLLKEPNSLLGEMLSSISIENFSFITIGILICATIIHSFLFFRQDSIKINQNRDFSYLIYSGYLISLIILVLDNIFIYKVLTSENIVLRIDKIFAWRVIFQTLPVFMYIFFMHNLVRLNGKVSINNRKIFNIYLYVFGILILIYVLLTFLSIYVLKEDLQTISKYARSYQLIAPILGFAGVILFISSLRGKFISYIYIGTGFLVVGAVLSYITGQIFKIEYLQNPDQLNFQNRKRVLQFFLQWGIILETILVTIALLQKSYGTFESKKPTESAGQYIEIKSKLNSKSTVKVKLEHIVRVSHDQAGVNVIYILNGNKYENAYTQEGKTLEFDNETFPIMKGVIVDLESKIKLTDLAKRWNPDLFFPAREKANVVKTSENLSEKNANRLPDRNGYLISRFYIKDVQSEKNSRKLTITMGDQKELSVSVSRHTDFYRWYQR